MEDIVYTRHSETRMRQRGMKNEDVALILACATQVDDETWMLREQDAFHAIEARKREIRMLERLKNRKLVMCGRRVVTVYPYRLSDQKHTLRRGRRMGLVE